MSGEKGPAAAAFSVKASRHHICCASVELLCFDARSRHSVWNVNLAVDVTACEWSVF